jgi:hypothetical protein
MWKHMLMFISRKKEVEIQDMWKGSPGVTYRGPIDDLLFVKKNSGIRICKMPMLLTTWSYWTLI